MVEVGRSAVFDFDHDWPTTLPRWHLMAWQQTLPFAWCSSSAWFGGFFWALWPSSHHDCWRSLPTK